MAAKRQKPAEMLQGKGSRFRGTSSLAIKRDEARPTPIPPAKLRKSAQDAWLAFWRSPMASLVQDESDMDALRDWALCLSERDRLTPLAQKEPLIPGSQGQLVKNPLYSVIADYTRRISQYREQFGMTPLSRMRLGIAVGEAHDILSDLTASLGSDEPEMVDLSEFDDVIEVGS